MFEPVVVGPDATARARLLDVLAAALEAADPRRAVAGALRLGGGAVWVGEHRVPLPRGRLVVLALGKAAIPMAWGAHDVLGGLRPAGVAATPVAGPAPAGIEVVEGSHPVPDERSRQAGDALMAAAGAAGPDDLVLVLVSGGGSACAATPVPGLGPGDLPAVTAALLASGAPIGEVNTVRRRLSGLHGGGLAGAVAPARMATLVLSDVVGGDLATIAGGPTVPDPSDPAAAIAVLERRGLLGAAGPGVERALRAPRGGPAPAGGPVVVVADGRAAAVGAVRAAERLGIPARLGDTGVTGDAAAVGARIAGTLLAEDGAGMWVSAGETTVVVRGGGSGGRNQEVAVAAAMILDGHRDVIVASLGTDGVDGPTAAAGGVVDGETVRRGREAGLDAEAALAANDSGTYLEAVGGRLVTGPTGTNVGDVIVAWRLRPRRPR